MKIYLEGIFVILLQASAKIKCPVIMHLMRFLKLNNTIVI